MKWGKLLGRVVTVAAPIVAGAVVSPEAGALVAAGLGGGAAAKYGGQKVEERTGRPVHKVGAPAAAIASSFLAAQVLPPEALQQICEFVQTLCARPSAAAMLFGGLGSVVAHQLGSNIGKTAGR